ncbi:xanthine dehydrogenase family protein molybdopterin-binding subunit [Halalkalibacter oceani]|uniref:xanthine dehydrogenase family protein molybdopterin-binding subunit n=1 Tax=Halalkalibacter oceani TaxID=1653776 RepID=UPI0033994207
MNSTFKSPHAHVQKLTGETRFVEDISLPGQLAGGILRSPHAHARIVNIDTTKALEIEGVHAVLTAADVPRLAYGPTKYKDWNIFAESEVLFIGDEVAAVAADSKELVQAALQMIDVHYEGLPAVFDAEEALSPESPLLHPQTEQNRPMHLQLERGDVETAKKDAEIVRGGRYVINPIYQGHLEPIAALASWSEEEGITLWAGSHIPYRARETYAAAFGLPEDRVRIIVPPIGGSFGAKYVLKMHIIAAALSMEAKRPVKMVFDRKEDMISAHPRVPLKMDVEIGATADGKFVYKDVVVYANAGARIYWSPNIVATACTRPDGIYHFNNVRAEGNLCYTNNSPTTCMRGFGNAEMLFAVESIIDEIADSLKIDPAELRRMNIVHQNERTAHGYQLDSCKLEECIDTVKKMANWQRRDSLPKNRGLGLALGNHVSGFRGIDPRFDGSTAVLRLKATGDIEVETGEIDLGQGLSQTYAKIAARELGISDQAIIVKSGDTARHPFGIGTLASRSTVMGGNAVQLAAAEFKRKLSAFMKELYGTEGKWDERSIVVGETAHSFKEIATLFRMKNAGEELLVRSTYVPNTELPDHTYYGNPSPNYPFAAHVAEVEVDPDTGRVKLLGYWAAHDSGTILNEVGAISQVNGAVAQGIGWVTMEELKLEEGRVMNPSIMDYRMPGAADIPDIQVSFIEGEDPHGPFGAKSVGEVALDPVPGAIANAIAHAIGKRGYSLPFTPEKVWTLLHTEESK